MSSNSFRRRTLAGRLICLPWIAVAVYHIAGGQTRSADEDEIRALLASVEFKDNRKAIIAMGRKAIPTLSAVFSTTTNEIELIRIMVVLRNIAGPKEAFFPRMLELAKASPANVQNAAILTLAEIGSEKDSDVLLQVVSDPNQPEASRINAARALAKIGPASAASALEGILQKEPRKPGEEQLNEVLRQSAAALRKRARQ